MYNRLFWSQDLGTDSLVFGTLAQLFWDKPEGDCDNFRTIPE